LNPRGRAAVSRTASWRPLPSTATAARTFLCGSPPMMTMQHSHFCDQRECEGRAGGHASIRGRTYAPIKPHRSAGHGGGRHDRTSSTSRRQLRCESTRHRPIIDHGAERPAPGHATRGQHGNEPAHRRAVRRHEGNSSTLTLERQDLGKRVRIKYLLDLGRDRFSLQKNGCPRVGERSCPRRRCPRRRRSARLARRGCPRRVSCPCVGRAWS
jgi:hypothetical protein